MVKVVGYWDRWFQHKENEYDVCWRFMLRHFGVDQIIMLPNLGVREKLPLDYTDTELVEMASVEEAILANPDLVPIIVDERGTTTLREFTHPENVLYIFGRTGFNPLDVLQPWDGQAVNIEGNSPYVGDALLHPHQACSIMLYDRMMKQWQ
jgi:hypothetical protein